MHDRNKKKEFDYFIKADDDSYIVMERLKQLLVKYNADETNWFGFHFHMYAPKVRPPTHR